MAEDRWSGIAFPILEFVHENGAQMGIVNIRQIAAGTGLEPNEIADEVERLCAAGFIMGPLRKMQSGGDTRPWFLESSHLGEKGLRAVGAWPSDDSYQALLDLLERHIASAPDPVTKSKLKALQGSVADVGKATIAGLLVEMAKGGLHY